MIKDIEPNDTTLEIKKPEDLIVSNSSDFKAPVEEKNTEESKEEINLSDYATDYLQSILDWRKGE